MSTTEALHLLRLATEAKVKLGVVQDKLWLPGLVKLKRLIDQNFFGGEMPAVTRTGLTTYAGTVALTDAKIREMIALAIGSNAYQWY